jgi:hypothetical protein
VAPSTRHPFPIGKTSIRARHYAEAAAERLDEATYVFRNTGYYALAAYLAGVSVECVLSALLVAKAGHSAIPNGHNLSEYLIPYDPLGAGSLAPVIGANVTAILRRWHHNLKYLNTNEAANRYVGKGLGSTGTPPADVTRNNADIVLRAAQVIYTRGYRLCQHYAIV